MIHDIVVIIWEDHVYEQESLVIYNNTIVQSLIIDVEPTDILSYVLCLGYIPSFPPLGLFCSWWLEVE